MGKHFSIVVVVYFVSYLVALHPLQQFKFPQVCEYPEPTNTSANFLRYDA